MRAPARFIGEIGNNHQGNPELAERMTTDLCNAGVWGVKSQKRDIESHPAWKTKTYDNPNSFGKTYYEHRKVLELDMSVHERLLKICKERGVEYFCSAWDMKSVTDLFDIGCTTIKIPSSCNVRFDMLDACRSLFKRIIISTGMTTSEELDEIIDYVNRTAHDTDYVVMLCTSSYPCHPGDIHLALYDEYRSRLTGRVHVGFSGHHKGRAIDYAAYAMGCTYIERHVTTDVYLKGTDHAAAMEIPEVMSHLHGLEKIRLAIGDEDYQKSVCKCETSARAKLKE